MSVTAYQQQPGDMSSGAIMRRAAARGRRAETFDPEDLVDAVEALLAARGLHPEPPRDQGLGGMASGAAGMLLRSFGIVPAGDFRQIDRLNAPDPDDR